MALVVCLALSAAEEAPAAGRPTTFTGWVGQFRIEASADPTQLRVGQSVGFQIQIRGHGTTGQPPLIRSDSKFTERFDVVGPVGEPAVDAHGAESVWSYSYRLAPKSANVNRIPPVRWSYYDEKTRQFQTVTTSAIPLAVLPSDHVEAEDVEPPASPQESSRAYAWFVIVGVVGLALLAYFVHCVHWFPSPPANNWTASTEPSGRSSHREDAIRDFLATEPPASRDAFEHATKQFRGLLAAQFGLPAGSVTSRDLLNAASLKLASDSYPALGQLLADLDRAQYGRAENAEAFVELHGRMTNWLQTHNPERIP